MKVMVSKISQDSMNETSSERMYQEDRQKAIQKHQEATANRAEEVCKQGEGCIYLVFDDLEMAQIARGLESQCSPDGPVDAVGCQGDDKRTEYASPNAHITPE
jgi:hypothetical protein